MQTSIMISFYFLPRFQPYTQTPAIHTVHRIPARGWITKAIIPTMTAGSSPNKARNSLIFRPSDFHSVWDHVCYSLRSNDLLLALYHRKTNLSTNLPKDKGMSGIFLPTGDGLRQFARNAPCIIEKNCPPHCMVWGDHS